jgi:quinol-cytochrome oxidoreductase complex cytochrome b subunit
VAVLVRAERRTPTEKVLAWLLAAAAVEFALLAVTGVFLIFFYRPSANNAWGDIRGVVHTEVTFGTVIRTVHRTTSRLMVLTVLAIAVVAVMLAVARSLRSRRHRVTLAAAIGIALVGVFESFTGFLLPWDQLALSAVTVGSNMMGFRAAWSSHVRFVLIGGATISPQTLRLWFLVHVLLVPAVLIGLGVLAAWRLLGRGDEPDGHTGLGS